MGPTWADIMQALCSAGALVAAVVGFGILICQVRQVERSIRGDTQHKLFSQSLEIVKAIGDHPEVRPYLFENREVSKDYPNYSSVLLAVELVTDFLNHVAIQQVNMSEYHWERWRFYIRDIYSTSPAIRDYISQHQGWYSHELLSLFQPDKQSTP